MSLHDYETSQRLAAEDIPFCALVMAAMRRADSYNLGLLKKAFPGTWEELQARYHAPGGKLKEDL